MPELEGQIGALDALLTQVAEAPTVVAIREKAEDSGHLDEDWILALTTGAASEEDERNARRHVVFCDQCADLLLNRGGELDEDESDDLIGSGAAPKTTTDTAAPAASRFNKPALLRLLVAALITALLGTVAAVYLPDLLKVENQPDVSGMSGKEIAIGARGAGDQEAGKLSVSRLAYVRLRPQAGAEELYAYVIVVTANGDVIRLQPKNGRAEATTNAEIIELPDTFGGYDLKAHPSLAAGQRVGFYVFTHTQRLPVFEGEIFELTTKPRIVREAKSIAANLDEANFRALTGKLREIGFGGSIVATSIRLIP